MISVISFFVYIQNLNITVNKPGVNMIILDKDNKTELVDSVLNGKKGRVAKIIRTMVLDKYKDTAKKRK
jgi:hypothetical protein